MIKLPLGALAERIVATVPFIHADLRFCARTEMAVHLDDLLRRMQATNPHVLDVQLVPLGAAAASYQLARSLSAW